MPESRKIRVMCVDDHPTVRDGISFAISNEPGMEFVGEATNGPDALTKFHALQPDVVLVDIQLPLMNGIDVIAGLQQQYPYSRCIVLTTYDTPSQIVRAMRAGAKGFLLKTMIRKQMLDAIRIVHLGGRFFPEEIVGLIESAKGEEALSPREVEILHGVADGLSNAAIGARLGISENTVKSYLKTANAKLHANDRTHAVLIAIRRGFLFIGEGEERRHGYDT